VNHRERVESVGTMSKLGRVVDPGPVQGESAACLDDIRHRGGVTLIQAFVWNVGTCRLDEKRDVQGRNPEGSVSMRGTGTERSVVVRNSGKARGSEGIASSGLKRRSTA
jgi:hypothetical protein